MKDAAAVDHREQPEPMTKKECLISLPAILPDLPDKHPQQHRPHHPQQRASRPREQQFRQPLLPKDRLLHQKIQEIIERDVAGV